MERNLLYKNLNGNTAFCTEESKIRWEAKHKTGKRIEATMAVSTAEAEESGAETTVAEPGIEPETDMEATMEATVEAVAVGHSKQTVETSESVKESAEEVITE